MTERWEQILEEISSLQNKADQEGGSLWFRGQRRACWTLKSRLHRYVEDCAALVDPDFQGSLREVLREEYKARYRLFKAQAWSMLEAHQRGEWSLVFGMQHHGIATRLLDWTESFACAVYFAQLDRDPAEDAAIFVADLARRARPAP